MKKFRIFALITTVATYLLILVGGLVRVSGAGLGCPDWPKCFGRWIPPTSVDQLPSEIDPAQFNFVLAWIEYINRLFGMMVGFLILIVALWAIFGFRRHSRILWPSIAAALLVAFQGWQGSVVVASELEPAVVTVHMLLALVIVSLLLWLTQEAWFLENPESGMKGSFPKQLRLWPGLLWLVGLLQIVLGTQIRSAVERLSQVFPLLAGADWMAKVGMINHIHMLLGVLLAALTWYVVAQFKRQGENYDGFLRLTVWFVAAAVTAQLVLGMMFILLGLTPLLQVFHLWMASIFIGGALLLYNACRHVEEI